MLIIMELTLYEHKTNIVENDQVEGQIDSSGGHHTYLLLEQWPEKFIPGFLRDGGHTCYRRGEIDQLGVYVVPDTTPFAGASVNLALGLGTELLDLGNFLGQVTAARPCALTRLLVDQVAQECVIEIVVVKDLCTPNENRKLVDFLQIQIILTS